MKIGKSCGGLMVFFILLTSSIKLLECGASGQAIPSSIKFHPLQFQTSNAASLASQTLPNITTDTNLMQLNEWLRHHLVKSTNGSANASNSSTLQVAAKALATNTNETYWFRQNGTPAAIKVKTKRAIGAKLDETARDQKVRSFVQTRRAQLKIKNADNEFQIRHRDEDNNGRFHYRLQQNYQGIKIWGAEAAVHLNTEGEVESLESCLIPTPSGIPTNPVVAVTDAFEKVNQQFYGGVGKTLDQPELVIDGTINQLPRLAWKFSMGSTDMNPRQFLVDAINGEIIKSVSMVMDGAVNGSGTDSLGVNRQLNLWQSGSTYYMLDTSKSMYAATSAPPALALTKGAITVLDARNQPPTASPTALPSLYYSISGSPNSGWVPDAVSAAFGLGKVYDYYFSNHARNSFDNRGSSLIGIVRYGSSYQNAYWTDQQKIMVFGDGFANSVDVCGHEVTHGVIYSIGDGGILEYQGQSGAINEALADIFGEMVEAKTYGTNDWLLGSQLNTPIRDMIYPENYGQPSTMSQYIYTATDNGGVHENSGIINHAFYLLANGLNGAIGNANAASIFYRAMTLHLLKQSQFIDARRACVTSAEELFGVGSAQAGKTAEAFDAVEIFDTPATAPPGTIPAVQAPDSTLALRWLNGYGYYLIRKETAFGDASTGTFIGTVHYLDGRRVPVSGDGSFAVFITSDNDFGVVYTSGTGPELSGSPGSFHSATVSPDGNRIALVLLDAFGNPDNQIKIVNVGTGANQTFPLYGVTSEGNYIDVVDHADIMDFTADGRYLIYDAYCYATTVNGDVLDGWTIFALDTTTGNIRTLADLNSDYDIGNPSIGNTHQNLIAVEVHNKTTGMSDIYSYDLAADEARIIGTVNGWAAPIFTGDDTAIIYSHEDATAASSYSLARQGLAADGITPVGAATWWLRNADYGMIYRRGTFSSNNAKPQVTMTVPTYGQVFANTSTIPVQVSASDADGSIAKVQFFLDATNLITLANAPYSISINNVPIGQHRLTARATDNLGAATDTTNLLIYVMMPASITAAPQAKTLLVGATASFSVTAAGTPPLYYQWAKDGTNILGATNASYSFLNAQTIDAGVYTVAVSNLANRAVSSGALLTVLVPPTITIQPVSQNVVVSNTASLTVAANGTAPLRYQWLKNAALITGATNASLLFTSIKTNDAGGYSVIITNRAGAVTSSVASLAVRLPTTFTLQATNRVAKTGASTVFSAAVKGTAPFSFQWLKNGVPLTDDFHISGSRSNVLSVYTLTTNDAGNYSLVASNVVNTIASSNAMLTVLVQPTITTQPTNQIVVVSNSVAIAAEADGTAPLRYQWKKVATVSGKTSTTIIKGATNSVYSFPTIKTNDASGYFVVITNRAGAITSSVANLTVLVPVSFSLQASNRAVKVGGSTTLNASVKGTPPFTYQWFKDGLPLVNGGNLSGANSNALAMTTLTTNDSGIYSLTVSNAVNTVISSNALLSVILPPVITGPPTNQTVAISNSVTFFVQVDGTAPFRYQWKKGTTFIKGATNVTYTIPIVKNTDVSPNYSVTVTNLAGTVTSPYFSLTVAANSFAAHTISTEMIPEGFPTLKLSVQNGSLLISWPTNFSGYQLLTSTNLTHWEANVLPTVITATNFVTTNQLTAPYQFFKLTK